MKYTLVFLAFFSGPLFAVDNVLVLDNVHGKVIKGGTYSSALGDCIQVKNSSNVVIQDATFNGCWLNGVNISNSVNISVIRNLFNNTGGATYAIASANIRILDNKSKDTMRRSGSARGQSITQFNNVVGENNAISGNYSFDNPLVSTREDAINIFSSKFATSSALVIENNIIRGSGTSASACGIVVNDFGGSDVIIKDNKLYNPGQCGIGIAGGERGTITGNTVYSAKFPYSNIGIVIWKAAKADSNLCKDNTLGINTIDWTHKSGYKNSHWADQTTCTGFTISPQINNVDLSNMVLPVF